jgi:N-methylhydantoinase A
LTSNGLSALVDAFSRLYRERYAFFFEGEPIELVNLRVAAFGVNDPIELPSLRPQGISSAETGRNIRPVYFEKLGYVETAVFKRDSLRPGMKLPGPAVVEEATSATLIPPGATADVAPDLGLFVRL